MSTKTQLKVLAIFSATLAGVFIYLDFYGSACYLILLYLIQMHLYNTTKDEK